MVGEVLWNWLRILCSYSKRVCKCVLTPEGGNIPVSNDSPIGSCTQSLYPLATFIVSPLLNRLSYLPTQGLHPPTEYLEEHTEAAALALSWKKKLYQQRTLEAISAPLGVRGLRKLKGNRASTPSLADYLQSGLQTSPPGGSGARLGAKWQ